MNRILGLIWLHVGFLVICSVRNAERGDLGWYLFDWFFILTAVGVLVVHQMALELRSKR